VCDNRELKEHQNGEVSSDMMYISGLVKCSWLVSKHYIESWDKDSSIVLRMEELSQTGINVKLNS
jgi:hypothetical protein